MCDKCTIETVKSQMWAGTGPIRSAPLVSLSGIDSPIAEVVPTTFSRIIDLTHRLTPDFPSFFGPAYETETLMTRTEDGFNLRRLSYAEHVGTHFDAPLHFSDDGLSIDEIPIRHLVCPLAVIDVRDQAAQSPDYRLGLADLERFEAQNGRIPDGACVAMFSGWEVHLGSERFRNFTTPGVFHFPGFHEETADYLIQERQVYGIAVDTMSLDFGATRDSPVHNLWLPSGRYGIENVANLGLLPPLGATLIAGAPKIQGTTGGPGRVMALV